MAALTQNEVRVSVAMQGIMLAVLVGRAGGSITVAADEYLEIVERYGGKANVKLSFVKISAPGKPDAFRATLVNVKSSQGELMS
jgi:hypothetical protein